MSNEQDIATIIKYTREIETILKSKFKAEGTGLHSQLNSIDLKLSDELIKKIRYIASVRNDTMHNHSAKVDIKSFFLAPIPSSVGVYMRDTSTKYKHISK